MKRTSSLIIVAALSITVPAAAQQEVVPAGPPHLTKPAVARALATAIADAARQDATIDRKNGDWRRVRRLSPGTEISVSAATIAGSYEVLAVDDAALTVLNSESLKSSTYAFQIRGLVVSDPKALAHVAQGGMVSGDRVRITGDGVFVDNRKVMETGELVVRLPRDEVSQIVASVRRGSITAAGYGVLLGLYCGVSGAYMTASRPPEKLLLIGGLPVLFGIGAYNSFSTTEREVIYRRR